MAWTQQMGVTDNILGQSHYFPGGDAAGKLLGEIRHCAAFCCKMKEHGLSLSCKFVFLVHFIYLFIYYLCKESMLSAELEGGSVCRITQEGEDGFWWHFLEIGVRFAPRTELLDFCVDWDMERDCGCGFFPFYLYVHGRIDDCTDAVRNKKVFVLRV